MFPTQDTQPLSPKPVPREPIQEIVYEQTQIKALQSLLRTSEGKSILRAAGIVAKSEPKEPFFGFTLEDPPKEGEELRPRAIRNAEYLSQAKFKWWRLKSRRQILHLDQWPESQLAGEPSSDVDSPLYISERTLVSTTLDYAPLFFEATCRLLFECYLPHVSPSEPVEALVTSAVRPFGSLLDVPAEECWVLKEGRAVARLPRRPGDVASVTPTASPSRVRIHCRSSSSSSSENGHSANEIPTSVRLDLSAVSPQVWRLEADHGSLAAPHAAESVAPPEASLFWSAVDEKTLPLPPAVVARPEAPGVTTVEASGGAGAMPGAVAVRVHESPFHVKFFAERKPIVQMSAISWNEDGRTVLSFDLGESGEGEEEVLVYGMGGRSFLRKNGRSWEVWNRDYGGYVPGDDPLPQCHTFALLVRPKARQFAGLFFDNPCHQVWDFTEKNKLVIRADQGLCPLRLFVLSGTSAADVMSNYTLLTGHAPMPPLWALGYHQCRWSYYPESRVMQLAATFRERDIPCDGIWLDIDYMQEYRCFTWDNERFPDPAALSKYLHDHGFRLVVIIDPGIKRDENYFAFKQMVEGGHACKTPTGDTYVGYAWPGACAFPDFTSPAARSWWAGVVQDMTLRDGVDGWWTDMNEPAVFYAPGHTMPGKCQHSVGTHHLYHNLYGQLMARATFEGLQAAHRDARRPFVLMRAGSAGAHRWGWVWTGDNRSTWLDLKMTIPMCICLGLSGMIGVGVDIGGFNLETTPELFARWLQCGIFLPFCRVHSAVQLPDQEPWSFGQRVEKYAREAIFLRYRLMPYLYTWMRQASNDGVPLMRPLWMEPDFAGDVDCFAPQWEETEFLVGPHLLVAPILEEGAQSRQVYLPKQTGSGVDKPDLWVDFYTNKIYPGGSVITVEAPMNLSEDGPVVPGMTQGPALQERGAPLFVRAGTVIPMKRNVGRSTADHVLTPANLTQELDFVYFGSRREEGEESLGTGMLYVDDGTSLSFQKDNYGLYKINSQGIYQLVEGKGEW